MSPLLENLLAASKDTPLLRLRRLFPEPGVAVYLKLEDTGPGGGLADRFGLALVEQSLAGPGGKECRGVAAALPLQEARALARAAASRGLACLVAIDEHAPAETERVLRTLGARVVRVAERKMAKRELQKLAIDHEGMRVVESGELRELREELGREVAREIWRDTDGRFEALVGSAHELELLSGAGAFINERRPAVAILGAGPAGSSAQDDNVDRLVTVDESEASEMLRRLAASEGILAGAHTGFALAAVARQLADAEGPRTLVAIADSVGTLEGGPQVEASEAGTGPVAEAEQDAIAEDAPGFATRAIHAGQEPDPRTGAVIVPIVTSSTFLQDGIGNFREGFEYSRTGNPTRRSLEETIAALENARHARCFASGSAATASVLDLLEPGDEVITTIDVYGGTYRLFSQTYSKYGIKFHFLDTSSAATILDAVTPKTRMLWIETPTNPMLNVIDIRALAEGRPEGVTLVVDNTFASSFLQNPLDHGADIVVHSATKYLGGHSDVVGGAVATSNSSIDEKIAFYQNAAGGVPSPFDCYLLQRGLKTLAVRMRRHESNGHAIAAFLREHPRVETTLFPGFEDHPGHEIVRRQMRGVPGMISFRIKGGRKAVDAFYEKVHLFALAESLGGVESLTCYPFTMTHGTIPEAEKLRIGITEDLIRLSVGIEDVRDLIEDLERALG